MAVDPKHRSSNRRGCNVAIGFADALAAPEVVWSLRDVGFVVTVLNRRGRKTPLRHAHGVSVVDVTPPEQDFARSVSDIAKAAESHNALLMPIDDAALLLCSQIAQEDPSMTIVGPVGSQAELALDKKRQGELATAAGLLVPPTSTVRTVQELYESISDFPVVLKAAEAVFLRNNRLTRGRSFVCADSSELGAAKDRWREEYTLLVQPLLSGVGEGVFGLRTDRGDLHLSAHRRIRMMNPQGSGSSACTTARVDPTLASAAARLLESAEWSGLFMLEFLRNREGKAWFMELNGRAWGSMALALRVGLDYPAWAVRSALDPSFDPKVPSFRPGFVCRHLGREIVHMLFALRGPSSAASVDWPQPLPTLKQLMGPPR